MLGKFGLDIIFRQLRYRDAELIANVSPQSLKHFIVELVLLVLCQQFTCQFQTLNGYFVSLFGLDLSYVCILGCLLAEEYHHHYKQYERNDIPQPI